MTVNKKKITLLSPDFLDPFWTLSVFWRPWRLWAWIRSRRKRWKVIWDHRSVHVLCFSWVKNSVIVTFYTNFWSSCCLGGWCLNAEHDKKVQISIKLFLCLKKTTMLWRRKNSCTFGTKKKKNKPEKNKTLVEIILLFQSFLFNYIIWIHLRSSCLLLIPQPFHQNQWKFF